MKTICLISLSVILISNLGVMSSQAIPIPAVDIGGVNNNTNTNNIPSLSLGWEFDVNTAIFVTALGFFDLGSSSDSPDPSLNLFFAHDIGIYDSTGNLLISGTVNPEDPLIGFFRYTSVTPTVLPIGTGYVIAAFNPPGDFPDFYTWDPGVFNVSPEIGFVRNRYIYSGTLLYPSNQDFDVTNAFFGPNFQYVPVPEPGTMLFLGSGLIGLFALRRRFKE